MATITQEHRELAQQFLNVDITWDVGQRANNEALLSQLLADFQATIEGRGKAEATAPQPPVDGAERVTHSEARDAMDREGSKYMRATLLTYIDEQEQAERLHAIERSARRTLAALVEERGALRSQLSALETKLASHTQANEALMEENKSLAAERDGLAAVLRKRCPSCEGIDRCYPDCAFTAKPASDASVAADNPGAGGSGESRWFKGMTNLPCENCGKQFSEHVGSAYPCQLEPANPQSPELEQPKPVKGRGSSEDLLHRSMVTRAELVAAIRRASHRGFLRDDAQNALHALADELERPA